MAEQKGIRFMETSAKRGTNVEQVYSMISNEIWNRDTQRKDPEEEEV